MGGLWAPGYLGIYEAEGSHYNCNGMVVVQMVCNMASIRDETKRKVLGLRLARGNSWSKQPARIYEIYWSSRIYPHIISLFM